MTTYDSKGYAQDESAARQAIATGVPQWIHTAGTPSGQFIDPGTGLPIAGLSSPAAHADWQSSFAEGFNDRIAAAIESGDVTIDFRPLLMTRPEVIRALSESMIGTLSMNSPCLEALDGDFVLKLRRPKSDAKPAWIYYRRHTGEEWPKFDLFDGSLDVAVGREGRVLLMKSACVFRDVVTTQVLNTYPF